MDAKHLKMVELPEEVLEKVFCYLHSPIDWKNCELVCHTWRQANLSEFVWSERLQNLFEGKLVSRRIQSFPKNKETYAFCLADSKREVFNDSQEVCQYIFSMRFKESTGEFWKSKNPPKNSNKHIIRKFKPDGTYWYPQNDPVFSDPLISQMLSPLMHWITWNKGHRSFMQLSDFPRMEVKRNSSTWGWTLKGVHTQCKLVTFEKKSKNSRFYR